jgi:glucokinase
LRSIDAALELARAQGWRVRGMGVSLPGTLDHTARRPLIVSLLPSLNNFPLQDFLSSRYQLPAYLHSDVDAAMLGEQHFGAGRGFRRLLYLTMNAVVGAAFVIDGQFERSTPYVGHVSHLPVSASGPRCSCGRRGCINTMLSLDALQRMVQRALRRGDETSLMERLLNREYFSPQLLAEEAQRGDGVALQIYSELGRWLGAAVNKYVELFDPHVLILGGNILCSSDLILSQMRTVSVSGSLARVCSAVEVVPACLGNDAALVGATVPLL